ncbi:shikimate kinase [Panicum miliaceum]|uniref:shikimate kinase n=1 Tax=Panicum miliaceum TaxID=4540 RepID=A0A3L6RX03_PANMI|nr:shikimate kinase [Panicum miliaceum]
MEAGGVGLALQTRAAGFGTGRRRGGLQSPIVSLRVADPAGAAVAVRARGSKPVAPLRAKKSSGGHENLHNSVDEALLLKRKSEEVLFYLNGRCIYLVGMMGSGKSTVGKIMSEVLGYSFFDRGRLTALDYVFSDKLVEQAVGMPSVAQIFKVHSEAFFRDNESSVLRDLSSMRRLVVATGGGAVIRPVNWKYMKKGLSVWLDVPLDSLARRIAKVGTASRPLLDQPSGDPYTMAFSKLSMLAEQRGDAYANADVRVSLEEIASKQGHDDVSKLTPTDIAIESLHKIESFVIEHAADNVAGDSQAESQPQFGEHQHWTSQQTSWTSSVDRRESNLCVGGQSSFAVCYADVSRPSQSCEEVTVGGAGSADRRQDLDHMYGWLDGPTTAARNMAPFYGRLIL